MIEPAEDKSWVSIRFSPQDIIVGILLLQLSPPIFPNPGERIELLNNLPIKWLGGRRRPSIEYIDRGGRVTKVDGGRIYMGRVLSPSPGNIDGGCIDPSSYPSPSPNPHRIVGPGSAPLPVYSPLGMEHTK